MADPWDITRKSIGSLSIWLGTGALFAPRAITGVLGVSDVAARSDVALPLLVRLVAARNIAMGAALLVTPPPAGSPARAPVSHSCATRAVRKPTTSTRTAEPTRGSSQTRNWRTTSGTVLTSVTAAEAR